MDIENVASLKHALLRGANMFLGSGFSVLANDAECRAMPVGPELASELRTAFDADGTEGLTLAQLYTVLARTRKAAVDGYLRERFTVATYDTRYLHFRRISVRTLFTTNIDTLLHRIYEDSPYSYLNDVNFAGPHYAERRAIDLVMLHGSVLDPTRPFRFGTLEVASSFGADPDRWLYLRQRIREAPTIFWGYSLQDAAALEAVRADDGGTKGEVWMQVRPEEADSSLLDYYRALDFQIIVADTKQLLNYLGHNLPNPEDLVARDRTSADTASLFPTEAIPTPGATPSRPISDFFQGLAPGWSDVFSQSLHRISHYRAVVESIRAGKPTIVTGIPGTGKTTLLMQIASELDFEGHKLMLDGASRAKAEMVARLLDGANALIVLDNFTNDADAFDVLQRVSNISVLAADRDYNLSSALHRLDRSRVRVIDVTELSDADLQDLRETIPSSVRKTKFVRPETSQGTRPSVFEFVQANVVGPTLRERFEEALRELRNADPELAEMLLLCAYVHHCRTPLSMDMALGYWRGRIDSYERLYERISDVGALLSEYEGDLASDEQDHFAARSLLAADLVVRAARGSELAEMLRRFHTHLSHTRITAYYVFKRRGYDSKLFGRAFIRTEDALELYDTVYARDPDAYTLQHKALLLSSRKRYAEAFQVMDRAVATAKSNWTIRSSYAHILFQANIELVTTTPDVRALLDRSMAWLTECYQRDRRRSMHAIAYANQAREYAKAFPDDVAIGYLEQADIWLTSVISDETWVRAAPYVRTEVRSVLRDLT